MFEFGYANYTIFYIDKIENGLRTESGERQSIRHAWQKALKQNEKLNETNAYKNVSTLYAAPTETVPEQGRQARERAVERLRGPNEKLGFTFTLTFWKPERSDKYQAEIYVQPQN